MEGGVNAEEFGLLKELAFLKEDLEWHIHQAELDCDELRDGIVPSVRAIDSAEAHAQVQPVLHTRLVPTEEVRNQLAEWGPAMMAEYKSLLEKGAIEEVADSAVEGWIQSGKNVELLPGRGVPTEKPGNPPGKNTEQ